MKTNKELNLLPCPHCEDRGEIIISSGGPSYYVYCTCGVHGPLGKNHKEAIAAWNVLPRRLKWTREKPTQDGFYWCRFRHPNDMLQLLAMVLVNAKGRYGITVGSSDAHDIDSYDAEWSGPIPEPEE